MLEATAMTVPRGLEHILKIDPQIMHGDLCFTGTRIPVTVFLDNLTEGMGIDEFLSIYPTIKREQAKAVLEWEHSALKQAAHL
jgi:uncharacterized protein (DUF433 family)